MSRSTRHPLQPETDHDGASRRLAVLACKRAVGRVLQTRLKQDYEEIVLPGYEDPPESANDVEAAIERLESYRRWAAVNRAAQDRMWTLLAEQADQDYGRISGLAEDHGREPRGSLDLADPDIPAYQYKAPIHGQPGGYMLERDDDDLAAGILYEAGGNLYAMGQGIGGRDSKGERLIAHVRAFLPGFEPKRILELGCSAGSQSTDYPQAFPEAECHALDLSPGMLRYAHARAEALGVAVHFRQADAAETGFPDAHFDLVVSHNLFHEVAAEHMPAIMAECRRLLAPGGVCIHQDVPTQTGRFDVWMQFISEWQKDNNDEPFWLDYANADLPGLMAQAGFDPAVIGVDYLQAIDGPIPWYVVTAIRG
jgi:SAM-dependent methyltransferase